MADVSVDASISTATARGMRSVVFTTDLIGYVFYCDSDGVFGYSKTTDGGATWGAQVNVDGAAATTVVAFDVWFDQWTPGDTGTRIHTWWFDSTNDIVRWRALNTTDDTLASVRAVFTGASAVAGRGAFVSGTKTRSGYLYCAYDLDAGAERGLHRSTDGGATFSVNLSTTFVEATLDTCKLYPASGTGDDNDCWALYYDASALALTLKLWDSSAATATESATIGVAQTDGATDLTGQFGYDAAVRHSDGHLIVAKQSTRDVAAGTHQVFDITDTSTITTKTAIAASTDDHYYPQVFIDRAAAVIYVTYNGKRDGSEVLDTTTKVYYTKSTDGGTTWSAGDTAYMEGAAGVVQQVWTPPSGRRYYAVWRVGTTLVGNKVNSVSVSLVTGATIGSTAQFPTSGTENPTPWFEHPGGAAGFTMDSPGIGHSQTISGHGGWLTAVSWWMQRSNVGAYPDSVYLELREAAWTGPLLATSAAVPGSSLVVAPSNSWIKFALPSPIYLAGATTYWMEMYLTRVAVDLTLSYILRCTSDDSYASGSLRAILTGAEVPNTDVGFQLHTLLENIGAVTVGGGGPATQAVTGATLVSTSVVYSPQTVSPGAVTLTGATLGSTAQLFTGTASTAAVAQDVTGPTLASGAAVTAGTVAPGAVTTTGATLTSGVVVRAGSVTPGAVTLTGATLTSGAVVRTGTVTTLTAVSGATRSSTVTLTAGSVTTTTAVTGATLTSGAQLFSGTVTTTTSVTGTTLASTLGLFPGAVSLTTAGAIDGAVILNSALLFPGLVTPGAVLVTGASRATSAQVFPGVVSGVAAPVVADQPFMWLM